MIGKHLDHILYPTGHHGVGKTELCDYLVDGYGFEVVETGAMVRHLYANRDVRFEDYSLGEYVRAMEDLEPGYFDKHLASHIDAIRGDHGRIIVNGMRTLVNIDRTRINYPHTTHSIVWIDAPFDVIFERYKMREHDELTIEEFRDLLDFDLGLGLALIKNEADFFINNDSHIDALRRQADLILQRRLGISAITPARSV